MCVSLVENGYGDGGKEGRMRNGGRGNAVYRRPIFTR